MHQFFPLLPGGEKLMKMIIYYIVIKYLYEIGVGEERTREQTLTRFPRQILPTK